MIAKVKLAFAEWLLGVAFGVGAKHWSHEVRVIYRDLFEAISRDIMRR